jgi:hypothetical protein
MEKLTEQNLGNIILCEPVTKRGMEALQQLGLDDDDVSENDFFEKMYITPKYARDAIYNESVDNPELEYVYSVSNQRFLELKEKLEDFNIKFTSDSTSESPLHIIGTAGNGKSIEARYKIRSPKKENKEIKHNHLFYNLEVSFTDVTYEVKFDLREFLGENEIDALWLICIVLLDEFYMLVKKHYKDIPAIMMNYQKYFLEKRMAAEDDKRLFSCIKTYNPHKTRYVRHLFQAMISLIDKKNASRSIENLLRKTMDVMYCINPENKNYIVFDNLEHHIELNSQNIPIHNKALVILYRSVLNVTGNLENAYKRIKSGEAWRAFKVILVLRRTSGHHLAPPNEHYPTKIFETGNDYTGHFDIWRIWEKKKPLIWDSLLKSKYDEKQTSDIFRILDEMMEDQPDKPDVSGTSYQALISPLMNSGIRRNGRAQAHAAMEVHRILFNPNNNYINFDQYEALLKDEFAARYLYRRALLELQYKWMIISPESKSRFEKLLLGKLAEDVKICGKDRQKHDIKTRDVIYEADNSHVTLVRRILSYLSNCKDDSVVRLTNETSFKPGLFEIVSFYDLMCGVFLNPKKEHVKKLNNTEHFLPLSKALISLGSMLHIATKAAPFVILDINDTRNYFSNSEEFDNVFAAILEEIWDAGPEKSRADGKYNCIDYGLRLTDAGDLFLRDIQPSFSFFAALYCNEEVPLFFLNDPERIKFVVTTVHNAAEDLCKKYEDAADSFCGGPDTDLKKIKDKYLPEHRGKLTTFRKRVIDLHSNHLILYKDFIDKHADTLGLSVYKSELIKHIDETLSSKNKPCYSKLKENEDKEVKCF